MDSSEELKELMVNIESGKTSRNKNYFRFLETEALQRFKRAKLLLSIINDIDRASKIDGNQIDLRPGEHNIEIRLFNPMLSYKRKTFVSKEEFELIKNQSKGLALKD